MNPEQPVKQVTDPAEAITKAPAKPAAAPQTPPATASNVSSQDLITNVGQSTWRYVKQHDMLPFMLMVVPAVLWEIFWVPFGFVILFTGNSSGGGNSGSGKAYGYWILFPFILIGAWYGRIRKKIEDAFVQQFAELNGFNYSKTLSMPVQPVGAIFNIAGAKSIQFSDQVTGRVDNQDFKLYLYQYTIQEGRDSVEHDYTVMEVGLAGDVPNILAKISRTGTFDAMPKKIGDGQAIQLEGDFNKYYTIYAKPGEEVNALEVFAPDLMQKLIDEPVHFEIELIGDCMRVYVTRFIDKQADLISMFNFAKAIGAKINSVAGRMEVSQFEATGSEFTQSHKSPINWGDKTKLIVVAVVCFTILAIVLGAIFASMNG